MKCKRCGENSGKYQLCERCFTAMHPERAKAGWANRKTETKPRPWKDTRRMKVILVQDDQDQWLLVLPGGSPMPATDVEVSLYLDLQEARERSDGKNTERLS